MALMDKYKDHPTFFLEDFVNPNQPGFLGDTLLHVVARIGTIEEIDLLIAAHAQINSLGEMGYTPMHYAASRGRLDIVEHLLELGADPNTQNKFGALAADVAVNLEHPEIATFIRNFNK